MANGKLTEKIKEIHAEFEGKYGSPRICQELQARKFSCSENRVARLMRENGLQAKHKRPFRVTTKANPDKGKPYRKLLAANEEIVGITCLRKVFQHAKKGTRASQILRNPRFGTN
ncbi:MAG: transposase [Chloroflexi bacterium]|nr:transposase [Chloroflexota bacterium]